MHAWKNFFFFFLLAAFAAALLRFPAESADAARQGLSLCLQTVLPALFPFFVFSSLFIATGAADALGHAMEGIMRPLFYLDGTGASAVILGAVGGYPLGARTTAELYREGSLSKAEAERLLGFCNNAGPGFLLGVCGGAVFHDVRAGLWLYAVHITAALCVGVTLRRRNLLECDASRRRRVLSPPRRSLLAVFPACVRDSFASAWSISGYIVIFAVLLRLLTMFLPAHPLLLGFLEMTNGVTALAPNRGGFVLCSALLAWGGLSIHAQTLSVLEDTGLSMRFYFAGKLLQVLYAAALSIPVSAFLFRTAL